MTIGKVYPWRNNEGRFLVRDQLPRIGHQFEDGRLYFV